MQGRTDLKRLFEPGSVAIIGASRNPEKVGHIILQNFIKAGYGGELYPINPNAEDILGLRAYKSVGALKRRVDLAVIAIPAEAVPSVLEECGRAGIGAAIVVSGGFAEVGRQDLQDSIVKTA